MAHYLHYHNHPHVLDRTKNHSDLPFDKIATDMPLPKDIVGSTIWGFTGSKGKWYILGRLDVTWAGLVSEAPDFLDTKFLFNKLKYTACCPTADAGNYRMIELEELAYAYLPDWGGGKEIRDFKSNQERTGMKRVEQEFVEEQLLSIEF
jgi:hypothetical protein|tara:strand:- start:113 stop:559 length:447 start_codon:yes stop_codon:yes gene_type:complete